MPSMVWIARFVVGGVMVSLFAVLGDTLKPKSFAGLFGAAPSVALATLTLTIMKDGASYAAIECRSMIGGAIAFFVYARLICYLMLHYRWHAPVVTMACLTVWLGCALWLWALFFR